MASGEAPYQPATPNNPLSLWERAGVRELRNPVFQIWHPCCFNPFANPRGVKKAAVSRRGK
ncbi:hypothetical protein D3C78_718580 [compost metagenome]